MPPRKKPHPRSLDALFGPKPRTVRKAPIKRCSAGHRQAATWRTGGICTACCVAEEARLREAEPLPPAWPGGRVPAVLTMQVHDTGRLIVHSIPKHLMRRPGTRGKRRR